MIDGSSASLAAINSAGLVACTAHIRRHPVWDVVLRGIVAKNWTKQAAVKQDSDEFAELRELSGQIGRSAQPARTLPLTFDDALWRTAESSGLTRLSSDEDAGPAAAAVVLGAFARHAAAVPIASEG